MPSEESMKKAREVVTATWPPSTAAGLHEETIEAFALALDEAKAERTEECARIADSHCGREFVADQIAEEIRQTFGGDA